MPIDVDLLLKIYPPWRDHGTLPREGGSADQDDAEMEALYLVDYMVAFFHIQLDKTPDTGARFEGF